MTHQPVDYAREEWSRITADPGIVDEEPWSPPDEPGHITPVGGWIFLSLVILAILGLIAWAVTRA